MAGMRFFSRNACRGKKVGVGKKARQGQGQGQCWAVGGARQRASLSYTFCLELETYRYIENNRDRERTFSAPPLPHWMTCLIYIYETEGIDERQSETDIPLFHFSEITLHILGRDEETEQNVAQYCLRTETHTVTTAKPCLPVCHVFPMSLPLSPLAFSKSCLPIVHQHSHWPTNQYMHVVCLFLSHFAMLSKVSAQHVLPQSRASAGVTFLQSFCLSSLFWIFFLLPSFLLLIFNVLPFNNVFPHRIDRHSPSFLSLHHQRGKQKSQVEE